MDKCRGCEAFQKCTAQAYVDGTCRYLRFSYGMDDRTEVTNADRIRAMSDDELAKFIKNIKVRAAFCKAVKNNDAFEELCSAEWLQQPAE